jgi:hypothetical protein
VIGNLFKGLSIVGSMYKRGWFVLGLIVIVVLIAYGVSEVSFSPLGANRPDLGNARNTHLACIDNTCTLVQGHDADECTNPGDLCGGLNEIILSECGELNSPDTKYLLAGDLIVPDSLDVCFNITASNVEFDGQDYKIIRNSPLFLEGPDNVNFSGQGKTAISAIDNENTEIKNVRIERFWYPIQYFYQSDSKMWK